MAFIDRKSWYVALMVMIGGLALVRWTMALWALSQQRWANYSWWRLAGPPIMTAAEWKHLDWQTPLLLAVLLWGLLLVAWVVMRWRCRPQRRHAA